MDNYLVIAIIGALARLLDVPLMVIRTNLMVSGESKKAGIIAGIEQFIYISLVFMSIQKALETEGYRWIISIAILSLGYGVAVYLGGKINSKLYPVKKKFRFIVEPNGWIFADLLRDNDFIVTTSISYGRAGAKKENIATIVDGKDIDRLLKIAHDYNQEIFYVVEPVVDARKLYEIN